MPATKDRATIVDDLSTANSIQGSVTVETDASPGAVARLRHPDLMAEIVRHAQLKLGLIPPIGFSFDSGVFPVDRSGKPLEGLSGRPAKFRISYTVTGSIS